MIKILKFLKKSWVAVVIIIALLWAQAMADLNLPDYTSKIVNVGIQQKGIENSSPDVIIKKDMDKVLLLSKEDEFIMQNYQIFSKENLSEKEYNKYLKKYPNIENQEVYVIKKIDKDTRGRLNIVVGKPLTVMYTLNQVQKAAVEEASKTENTQTAEQMQSQITQMANFANQFGFDISQLQEKDVFEVLKSLPEQQQNAVLDIVNSKIDEMQDSIIIQTAVQEVGQEYIALGVDAGKLQTSYILIAGIKMLAVALGSMICAILITFLSAKTAAKLGKTLREKVYQKVLSFSSTEYRKFGSNSLITRNTNDTQQIQNIVPMLFRVVFYAPLIGIGAFLKVISSSQNSMAWIIGVAIGAVVLIMGSLFICTLPKFKKLQDLIDKLNGVSREILSGIPVIRAFNKEKFEEAKFDDANKNLAKTTLFVTRTMGSMMPALMFIMNSVSLLIIWVGAEKVDSGFMQVGNVMTFIQYAMQIITSFLFISILSIMLPRASVSANRITDVLETEPLIKDSDKLEKFDQAKKGLVEFKNVSFRYPDADTELLTDISFVAKPGETTAIIGSTGSGKSTIVNLIPRFYDVTGGELLIDGVNIKNVSQKDLRDVIGFVPQKGVLFSGTIESNIKYSNEDMSNEQMEKAAKIAQAEDFISEKVDVYQSSISQGGNNVSGGQKQRLSIARAIAKNPEIFVFDDSFSALDFKTDLKLRTALEEVTQDKTVIIVAQRISTIMNANQIIVLDEGKIVGKGTHEELLENNDVYKQIALSQLSKGELENGR